MCIWDENICYKALKNGHLKCFKYTINNVYKYNLKKFKNINKSKKIKTYLDSL